MPEGAVFIPPPVESLDPVAPVAARPTPFVPPPVSSIDPLPGTETAPFTPPPVESLDPLPSEAVPDAPVSATAAAETVPLLSDAQTQSNIDQAQKDAEEWARAHGKPVTNVPQTEISETPSVLKSLSQGDIGQGLAAAKENVLRFFTEQPDKYQEAKDKEEASHQINFGQYPVSPEDSRGVRYAKEAFNTSSQLMSGLMNPQTASLIVAGYGTGGAAGGAKLAGGVANRIAAAVFALQSYKAAGEQLALATQKSGPEAEQHAFNAVGQLATGGLLTYGAAGNIPKPEEINATEKGQVTGDGQQQYQGTEAQRLPAEAGDSDVAPPSGQGSAAEPVPSTETQRFDVAASQPAKDEEVSIGVGAAPAESGAAPTPETTPETGETGETGIANRILQAEAEAGKIGGIESGEGMSWQEMVEHGRDLLNKGADPQAIARRFKRNGRISPDDFAVLRAERERLAVASNEAAQRVSDNPGDKSAAEALTSARGAETAFIRDVVQPAKTATSDIFRGMQGEAPVDTTTFEGLRRALLDKAGREPTDVEAAKMKGAASKVKTAISAEVKARDKLNEAISREGRRSKTSLATDAASLKTHFAERLKTLLPC